MKELNRFVRVMTICSIFPIVFGCSNIPVLPSEKTNLNVPVSQQPSPTGGEKNKEPDQPIRALVPKGWRMLEKSPGNPMLAAGDLNKDGVEDAAVILEQETGKDGEVPNRALFIAFGDGNGGYQQSILAVKAILRADQGGAWGDPLEGISVDNGSLVISFYGGSNDRWYANYRFRFQDNDWYLIGATMGSYFTGTMTRENANEEDYNLLTGDYIIRATDEQNPSKSKTTKGNRGKAPLLKLKDFHADAEKEQFLN
ncbi:hypothetical protein [Paenibacillus sp. J31TS4]|uniref:hypothetical protein n=1 Tax=Paenibacillus sp. J31TS4 TaxID=2807195 RepID=UPI001BD195A5|nr:hypothetical protein [Paenibacillus sp. J31TS4]